MTRVSKLLGLTTRRCSLSQAVTHIINFTAFDMGMKKSGHNMNRDTSEKITDGARSAFEKVTGKKVDPKISN